MKKLLSFSRVTADGVLTLNDFKLVKITVTGDGANKGKVVVYSGRNNTAPIFQTLRVTADQTLSLDFTQGIYFPDGLYVDLTTVDEVIIYGEPIKL